MNGGHLVFSWASRSSSTERNGWVGMGAFCRIVLPEGKGETRYENKKGGKVERGSRYRSLRYQSDEAVGKG